MNANVLLLLALLLQGQTAPRPVHDSSALASGPAVAVLRDAILMTNAIRRQTSPGISSMEQRTELRERALETLQDALADPDAIKRIHAAEALIWNGYKAEPRRIFENALPDTRLPIRIGYWRVLAQAGDRAAWSSYTEQVRKVALDMRGPYAEFAVESLAKLGYAGRERPFMELARSGSPVMQILARWVLANSGRAEEEAYLAELFALPDARMRGVTAYALRFLKRLRPETLQKLRAVAARESRNSEGRVFLLTTLYLRDPQANRAAVKRELFRYAEQGSPEARYQALLVLGRWMEAGDLARVEPLLRDEDTDARIAAAHAILTTLTRLHKSDRQAE
jgi:HEAT repeat protein